MNTNVIEGNPTKKFFIEMITRDISIEDAIIDLLDNSIDGATQINSDDLSGFVINIEIDAVPPGGRHRTSIAISPIPVGNRIADKQYPKPLPIHGAKASQPKQANPYSFHILSD